MTDNNSYADAFSKFVPGFEFLQGLVKNAGKALPNIGQWVAPTLDPEELDRRISELRTVQFWLEQNARMIATTVQALEVQRMTLGTLKSMNVPMGDLSELLKVRSVADVFQATAGMAAGAAAAPAPAPAPAAPPAAASAPTPETESAAAASLGAVDPMQWWGALTQQFTQLASQAMKATSEATAEAAAQATQAMQAGSEAAASAAAAAASVAAEAAAAATAPIAAAANTAAEATPARKRAARSSARTAAEPAPAPAAKKTKAAPAAPKAAAKRSAR